MGVFRCLPFIAATVACWAIACSPAGASSLPLPLPSLPLPLPSLPVQVPSLPVVSTGSVRAGASAYLTIALAAPANHCQLVAFTPGQAPMTLSQLRPTGLKVTWTWQVPRGARSATWQLLATCGSSEIGAVLTVHGRRHRAALALARRMSVLQYNGTSSSPQQLQVIGAAQAWWASSSSSILSSFQTGPAAGECTAYVAARRPDIVERVDIWAYSRYLLANGGGLNVDWAAKYWAANAQQAGLAIGKIPRPGAVVVFQPGSYGAFSDGHVAYVDAVGRRGSFTISEMHAPLLGHVSSRHFSARTARAMSADPGVTFIYR